MLVVSLVVRPAEAFDDASIVRINADIPNRGISNGSGCFWLSGDQILTAYHVIQGADRIRVYAGGKAYKDVQVVSISPSHDLALLQVGDLPPGKEFPPLSPWSGAGPPFHRLLPVEVSGHPIGWHPTFRLEGRIASRDYVPS
ncbi:MAG: trypsin-like peptidase domain-containing protein, partial [Actinomycetia bacterium]|nr:trypsin-like peptidase domain-containing protein [Actinomycetes bacterium]